MTGRRGALALATALLLTSPGIASPTLAARLPFKINLPTAPATPPPLIHPLGPGRFSNTPDTSVVWSAHTFTRGSSGTWTVFTDSLNIASFDSTRRYIFRFTNGDNSGGHRISQLSLLVNGKEVMNASDISTTVASAIKIVYVQARNGLQISVAGTSGSYIQIDMISTPDPSYPLFGPQEYAMEYDDNGNPINGGDVNGSFSKPAGAAGPYTLVLTNGAQYGCTGLTCRLYLNNTLIVPWTNMNASVAGPVLIRHVSLQSSNSFTLRISGDANNCITLAFTATDTTPPAVSLTAPQESLFTTASSVIVSGSVSDEAAGTVSVNGGTPHVTPGSFADTLALAADGRYTITIHAQNKAGYGTDIVRHVTRDTQAPILTVSTPATPAPTVTTDSLQVQGVWHDLSPTAITIDGDTAAVDTGGSFSKKIPLDFGSNVIYFKAVDRLGHVSSFNRYVLRTVTETVLDSTLFKPALSTTKATPFLGQVRFLYADSSPLQVIADTTSLSRNSQRSYAGACEPETSGHCPMTP